MKVVFGKSALDKIYEKVCDVLKENNNKTIEYVILSEQEFEECVIDVPLYNMVVINNSGTVSELFVHYGIYFIKQIPLDYAYIGMYEQILEKAKEYLND